MSSPSGTTVYWLDGLDASPLIVGQVEYRAATRELCFYDTQRPHQLGAELLTGSDAAGFVFRRPDGRQLTLRVLDTTTFDARFRQQVFQAPAFTSNAELQAFYQRLFAADPV